MGKAVLLNPSIHKAFPFRFRYFFYRWYELVHQVATTVPKRAGSGSALLPSISDAHTGEPDLLSCWCGVTGTEQGGESPYLLAECSTGICLD